MPMYYFRCPDDGQLAQTIRRPENVNKPLECPQCKKPMVRDPRGASSRITETLDNGVMTRRVERPADVERLNWERSRTKPAREP
jgi:hypothetical protein